MFFLFLSKLVNLFLEFGNLGYDFYTPYRILYQEVLHRRVYDILYV